MNLDNLKSLSGFDGGHTLSEVLALEAGVELLDSFIEPAKVVCREQVLRRRRDCLTICA